MIDEKILKANLAVVPRLIVAAARRQADSPAAGRNDSGNRRAFVNLSVKANLKMAPGIFHG